MNEQKKAESIVAQMMANDDFSQWLGIEVITIEPGKAKIRLTVRKEMTNGMDIAHGGITYSLSDSAFAFASNSRGRKAVSVETSISHTKPVNIGDVLTAAAQEDSLGNKIGVYHIKVTNQKEVVVALFKGTVYRTSKEWEV